MRKTILFFGLLLFFVCPFFVRVNKTADFCYAQTNSSFFQNYKFIAGENIFDFSVEELSKNVELSKTQKGLLSKHKNRFEIVRDVEQMGLTKKEAICYAFPEIKYMLQTIQNKVAKQPTPNDVQVVLNKCEIKIKNGSIGQFVNEQLFFDGFYEQIKNKKPLNKFNLEVVKFELKSNLASDFVERGYFSTDFSSSSIERKNNIRTALACFDGFVLNEGEVLSFNKTTGARSESNGYKQAKIITDGTFTSGFGGGVCQVSTTLYNACLLAGLEIVEVHPHSLPVGYVEPSFDAMVNMGSSDLVIKNNTGSKIIFTTSNQGDQCKVKIFGKKNKYKITRISEKTKAISGGVEVVEKDYKKFGLENLVVGEEKRISFAKDGYASVGYLNYFDENGTLIKSLKIRENEYKPVKGVVVKRES